MPKACERTYTDQSVINALFGNAHGVLEGGYNQIARFGLGPPYTTNDSVMHFVGWPKPWANASRKYQAPCGATAAAAPAARDDVELRIF